MSLSLPEGWIECLLSDYLIIKNGFAFKSTDYQDDGIPLIRISDIQNQKVLIDKAVRVSEKLALDDFKIEKEDLLIAMSGATTGKVGVYYEDTYVLQNQRVGNIKLKDEENGDKKFRNYLIQSLSDKILNIAYGGAQPNISPKVLGNIKIPLPPLTEQKKIAKKLDKLLARVERIKTVLDNAPAKIKRFRQSVLASAVGGEFSKNKNITKLPLNKLGSISGGKTPSKSNLEYWTDGSVFWVSAKDMKRFEIDSSIDKITEKAVSEAKMKLIPINSILMVTRSGILAHTFPVAINTTEITINQDLKAFNVNSEIVNYKFLAYILKGKSQNILKECSKDGTTVPSVSTEKLMNYMLNIPNLEEQKAIVKKVETLFAIADKMEANIAEAQKRVDKLTQSILAKAFRGVL